MTTELEKVALEAVFKAGKILKDGFYTEFAITQKSNLQDLVTFFDVKTEQILKEVIRSHFPSHAFWGEEEGIEGDIENEITWIMDPIDGTWNFARQIPSFCIGMAAFYKGDILLGISYDPIANELFIAQKQKGAFMNGRKIKVSSIANLPASGISVRSRKEVAYIHEVAVTRRSGSSILDLSYVAKGSLDGFIEWGLSVWDFAGMTLLIQEAGGIVTDEDGNIPVLQPNKKYTIVATNGLLHDELLKWISTAKK
ncbi:MAG: inositol monophosphatase [Verrucomicrobia bacterium]|nr:inositol monophosphatase [Verrucomicrobiota bacterium]